MPVVRHPLVDRDLVALLDHVIEMTGGDFAAAGRRLDEVDDFIKTIAANPIAGMRLGPPLEGWLVRHGGHSHRLTIVFHVDAARDCIFVALVAFGGQDWMTGGKTRKAFAE